MLPYEKVRDLLFDNSSHPQTPVHVPPKRLSKYGISLALFKTTAMGLHSKLKLLAKDSFQCIAKIDILE